MYDAGRSWFGSVAGSPGRTRLFVFPFAGGIAASFLGWQALLGPAVELHVAQLPARGSRLFEPPLTDMDELVSRLAGAVADLADRPFGFFGHSLGALLAFEVARALRRAGSAGPRALWLCGAEGPQTRVVRRELHRLPDAALVEELRTFGATPAELLADPEMMELLLPGIRADFTLAERYTYTPEPPLDVPIHVLLGDRDGFVDIARAEGWARESTRRLSLQVFPGGHFFVEAHRVAIAAAIAGSAIADISCTTD
jgi:medium-chain acyl-[acyl-carrier-protein] hydrolase